MLSACPPRPVGSESINSARGSRREMTSCYLEWGEGGADQGEAPPRTLHGPRLPVAFATVSPNPGQFFRSWGFWVSARAQCSRPSNPLDPSAPSVRRLGAVVDARRPSRPGPSVRRHRPRQAREPQPSSCAGAGRSWKGRGGGRPRGLEPGRPSGHPDGSRARRCALDQSLGHRPAPRRDRPRARGARSGSSGAWGPRPATRSRP